MSLNIVTVEMEIDVFKAIDALTDEIPPADILRALSWSYRPECGDPLLHKIYRLINACACAIEAAERESRENIQRAPAVNLQPAKDR